MRLSINMSEVHGSLGCCRLLLFRGSSGACLTRLCSLLLVNISALVLTLITAVIVPAALATIVVVSQNKRIDGGCIALSILDVCDAVELFADGALHDDILLVLVILGRGLEVQLVVICVGDNHLGFLHVYTDRQDAL